MEGGRHAGNAGRAFGRLGDCGGGVPGDQAGGSYPEVANPQVADTSSPASETNSRGIPEDQEGPGGSESLLPMRGRLAHPGVSDGCGTAYAAECIRSRSSAVPRKLKWA